MNLAEMALMALDWLAGRLGFALVPVADAELLADVKVAGWPVAEGGTS
jgi:hypothetical protein